MIVSESVKRYVTSLRAEPDAVLAEMEAQGDRDHIPIVEPETGMLLYVLAAGMGARRVVEIGTAIGVSTLYLARALPEDGTVVSFEVDPERQEAARRYLEQAGVADRVDLRLEPALDGLARLEGPFDLAFLDALKGEYAAYLDAVVPLLRPRGVVVVDNVLMSGAVAEGRGDGHWSDEAVRTARAFNEQLLGHPELSGTVTPVGDGVALAVKRAE
jgi:predicted O-methyltransferase YrrM